MKTHRSAERPLRTMFLLTSMPVGGAETLLVNLVQALDRRILEPEICCLKQRGPLGEVLARTVPVHSQFIRSKYDIRVLWRLMRLFRSRQVDAVITVGAGDKMFWGRIAARLAGIRVIISAIHSTGWPDGIGRLNRLLTPITDAFVAVASTHRDFLIQQEHFPSEKVRLIPNGIRLDTYVPPAVNERAARRRALGLPVDAPLGVIVAALRPEKNHRRFLRIAAAVRDLHPSAEFLILGDGPERLGLETYARQLQVHHAVHFLGSRDDVSEILPACDVFVLTSDNEASPVSIAEAMACGLPIVAPQVGSIPELVMQGESGFLVDRNDEAEFVQALGRLFQNPSLASRMGDAAHQHVQRNASLTAMVDGYQQLVASLFERKCRSVKRSRWNEILVNYSNLRNRYTHIGR